MREIAACYNVWTAVGLRMSLHGDMADGDEAPVKAWHVAPCFSACIMP